MFQIGWNICFIVIWFLAIQSLRLFVYAEFVVITTLELGQELNEITISFEL